jgi:two-component system chemotaxis response regulator CheB
MTDENPLRVLVVDDTVVYRKIVSDVLAGLPGIELVGTAYNGKSALSRIANLRPDLLTLDIEMPEMNGLETLQQMQTVAPDVGAIMLSSLTVEGGEMTMRALELGAFDFIPKPQEGSMEENTRAVREALIPMLKAFARRREIKSILKGKSQGASGLQAPAVEQRIRTIPFRRTRERSDIVGIGVSTGGPNALARMMPKIPADIDVPILIVQHMPPVFTQSLARSLDAKCAIEVKEACDGEPIRANVAFIAPGGKQMKVAAGADGRNRVLRITDDPPENSCRPSVDFLFRSIAHHYVGRATGVIMTGMGSDGTLGLKLMKRNGAAIIAQDEETCVVYGMPKAPIESGIVDSIAPLDRIAEEICRTVGRPGAVARLRS